MNMKGKKLLSLSRVHIPAEILKELGINYWTYVEVQLVGREFHIFDPRTKTDSNRVIGNPYMIDNTGRICLGKAHTKQLGWIENETQLVVYKKDNEIIVREVKEYGRDN